MNCNQFSNPFIGVVWCVVFVVAVHSESASGSWFKKTQRVSGSWTIDGRTLTLTGFKTKKAPDLKIFLSPHPVESLTNKNATRGAKRVALLRSPTGDQAYTLPAGVKLSDYRSIMIHCEKYSKLWGAAPL